MFQLIWIIFKKSRWFRIRQVKNCCYKIVKIKWCSEEWSCEKHNVQDTEEEESK